MGLKYSVQTLIQEATFPFWFVPMCHAKCQARLEPGHGVHGTVLRTGAQKESSTEGFFLGLLVIRAACRLLLQLQSRSGKLTYWAPDLALI